MRVQVDNVKFSYGHKEVLKEISFDADAGEVIGIMGQNGCGKTTLLKCINGSITPTSGSVHLDGEDTSLMSKKDIAKKMA